MHSHVRLKEERERLGFSQIEFAESAGTTRKTLFNWENGTGGPTPEVLATWAALGVDVQYVVTGQRQGQGIGESAVFQAVLNAVDLLSLEKKVDADQLAKAVVKLCARQAVPFASAVGIQIQGGQVGNVIHGSVDQSGMKLNVGGKKRR